MKHSKTKSHQQHEKRMTTHQQEEPTPKVEANKKSAGQWANSQKQAPSRQGREQGRSHVKAQRKEGQDRHTIH